MLFRSVAIIALTTYIYLTLVAFNFISGVLTLPGLAALVLGVGMAVDAKIGRASCRERV